MHKDDRELLELAALAADVEHGADRLDCGLSITLRNGQHRSLPRWNPLDDDTDALRLAVKLNLRVMPQEKCVYVESNPDSMLGFASVSEMEMNGDDPYAATRRTIVRAAAEIGRGMK